MNELTYVQSPHVGGICLYEGNNYFERNTSAKIKYILVGSWLCLNMKLALFYNLNFTRL
jgi:hypothetical protein